MKQMYGNLVETALLGVVKQILTNAAKNGLVDKQHFYIQFQTGHHNAVVADFLKTRYPETITIVLQHQFFGLCVFDDHFSVVLTFDGRQERLVVPFDAIVAFSDPSVNFGLQFSPKEIEEPVKEIIQEPEPESMPAGVVSFAAFKKKK